MLGGSEEENEGLRSLAKFITCDQVEREEKETLVRSFVVKQNQFETL